MTTAIGRQKTGGYSNPVRQVKSRVQTLLDIVDKGVIPAFSGHAARNREAIGVDAGRVAAGIRRRANEGAGRLRRGVRAAGRFIYGKDPARLVPGETHIPPPTPDELAAYREEISTGPALRRRRLVHGPADVTDYSEFGTNGPPPEGYPAPTPAGATPSPGIDPVSMTLASRLQNVQFPGPLQSSMLNSGRVSEPAMNDAGGVAMGVRAPAMRSAPSLGFTPDLSYPRSEEEIPLGRLTRPSRDVAPQQKMLPVGSESPAEPEYTAPGGFVGPPSPAEAAGLRRPSELMPGEKYASATWPGSGTRFSTNMPSRIPNAPGVDQPGEPVAGENPALRRRVTPDNTWVDAPRMEAGPGLLRAPTPATDPLQFADGTTQTNAQYNAMRRVSPGRGILRGGSDALKAQHAKDLERIRSSKGAIGRQTRADREAELAHNRELEKIEKQGEAAAAAAAAGRNPVKDQYDIISLPVIGDDGNMVKDNDGKIQTEEYALKNGRVVREDGAKMEPADEYDVITRRLEAAKKNAGWWKNANERKTIKVLEERQADLAAGGASGDVVTPPAQGDVVDGYRFNGGNANDPANWTKV